MPVDDWRQLSDLLREQKYGRFEDAENAWFLVLDDIGSDYDPNKFSTSKLDKLLRSRRHWTVITTNLTPKQIAEELDPRIVSWMIRDGNKIVQIDAPITPFANKRNENRSSP